MNSAPNLSSLLLPLDSAVSPLVSASNPTSNPESALTLPQTAIGTHRDSNLTRVLLIDDDEDEWLITRDLLREVEQNGRLQRRSEGHSGRTPRFLLDWVPSFEAGLEAIARAQHDVYLVDYQLGARSGLELLAQVQARGVQAPLILLTGQGDPDVDAAATEAGAADYLVKDGLDAALLERAIRYSIAQKAHQEALREVARQNERLSAAIESAEIGVVIAERASEPAANSNSVEAEIGRGADESQFVIVFANAAFEAICGTSPDRVLGQNLAFLHCATTDLEVVAEMQAAIAAGRPYECLAPGVRENGTPFWNALQISPVLSPNGEATTWIGFLRDVSAKIEADRALLESQETLAAAQRLGHVGSWTAELEWDFGPKIRGVKVAVEAAEAMVSPPPIVRFTRPKWSDEVFRILGFEPGAFEPTRERFVAMIHPDDREIGSGIAAALSRGEIYDHSYRIVRPGGEVRVVHVHAELEAPASLAKSARTSKNALKTRQIVGTLHDVTERIEAQNLARESQERLKTVVQNAPLLIWSLDAQGRINFIEGRALASLGLCAADFQAAGAGNIEAEASNSPTSNRDKRQRARSILKALLGAMDGADAADVGALVELQGLWFETKSSPLRDKNGQISGVVGVATDVTERVRAQTRLDESEARLSRIVSNVPGMVYRFHRSVAGEVSFLEVSEGCFEIYGARPAEVLRDARVLTDVVHPDDLPEFGASVLESERTLLPWIWQGRILHSSGETRWIQGQARPLRQHDGSTVWDGLVIDVTEQHRVQTELLQSRNAFDEAQKLACLGSFEWNLATGDVKWSDQMFRLLGHEPQAFIPTYGSILEFIHPDERREIQDQAHAAIEQANAATLLIRIVRPDGAQRFWQTLSRVEVDANGQAVRLVGSVQDVTESVEAERALRESEQRYALAAQGANDGLWDWNLEQGRIYLSPRWKMMLGHAVEEIGDDPDEWFSRVHPDDSELLRSTLDLHLSGESAHFECQYRLRCADGQFLWMLGRGLAVTDETGVAGRIAGSQTDISQRKTAEEQLSRNAFYDTLTGLPNRALFLDRLQRTLTRAQRNPDYGFAVLFLDIDRFKKINDSLGHLPGDQLLIQAAHRFETCLRPGDTVARLGGDEFAILLDDISSDGDGNIEAIDQVAGRIQKALELPFLLGKREVFVTVSIGIAPCLGGAEKPDELLRNADTAMYRAKSLGRSRHEVFDATMHQRAVKMLEMESDLWRAVERDELRLFFQPIISLDDGQICGFEALVRWEHPERGLVPPSDFIPLAEETGLIVPIDWWVLERACRQGQIWREKYAAMPPFFMAVNLSSKQFSQGSMIERVRQIATETGFDPRFLKLEITESVIMENTDSASTMLLQLRAMGIRLSMDDFGTGYSSLSYLHRFSLDTLKIDRSFVSQMRVHPKNREIIGTIISLANGLSMNVVAEGVETDEQLRGLRKLGCGYAQGFLFSRPVPAEEIEALVAENRRW